MLTKIPTSFSTTSVGDEQFVIIMDTETTGLNPKESDIIELGMIKLAYSPSAKKITAVSNTFEQFQDPGYKISNAITKINNITDAMVKGKTINDKNVKTFMSDADIIIAHNASFDRPFFEKRFPSLNDYVWGCSKNDVKWPDCTKLKCLLAIEGYCYPAHRALNDCYALAWLLFNNNDAFASILTRSTVNSYRVKAWYAPYSIKDDLKERGYRWDANRRVWWTTIEESVVYDEQAFLKDAYDKGHQRATFAKQSPKDRFK